MKNKINHIYYIFSLSIIFTVTVYGQYPQSNRLFFQNKFGINVAYAGELETTRLTLVGNYTSSKLLEGNNSWQQLSLDIPLGLDLSTGTRISNVSEGFLSQQIIEQAIAYRLYFSRDQTLCFGLGFGINRQTINNRNGLFPNDYVDMNDPIFNTDLLNRNNLQMEIGAVYKQEQFELSLSLPSVIKNNRSIRGITAYAAYHLYPTDDFKITPSLLLMKTYYNNYEITSGINFGYLEKSWMQLSYINSKQFLIAVGTRFNNLGFGYNYSMPFDANYTSMLNNSHQLGLNYNF
jgi:type IX secretion system PorP/SprF family membrane protein